jgi:hypothetical protein
MWAKKRGIVQGKYQPSEAQGSVRSIGKNPRTGKQKYYPHKDWDRTKSGDERFDSDPEKPFESHVNGVYEKKSSKDRGKDGHRDTGHKHNKRDFKFNEKIGNSSKPEMEKAIWESRKQADEIRERE